MIAVASISALAALALLAWFQVALPFSRMLRLSEELRESEAPGHEDCTAF